MRAAIKIRQASVEDASDVLEIERSCAQAPHWSEGVWAQILAQCSNYGPQRTIYGPQRTCLVAEHADETVGFLVLGIAAGVAELESLAVAEFARRHGAGRSLCLHAALLARAAGAESVQLEVRAADTAALAFYRCLGFMEQGRRTGYYAEPKDDAVLMALRLRTYQYESAQGRKV